MNINDFIKQHKHIRYCEAVIYKDGSIDYAIPSHQECLFNIVMDKYNISKEELWNRIPITADVIEWLLKETDCILVWYQFYLFNIINDKQKDTLNKLIQSNIVNFEVNRKD